MLFDLVSYTKPLESSIHNGQFPKISNDTMASLFTRMKELDTKAVGAMVLTNHSESFVFYQEAAQYWIKVTVGLPYYCKNGQVSAPSHGRYIFIPDQSRAQSLCALIHSSLFYIFHFI